MDLKISQLPQASSINFSDEFAIAQSGTTKSINYSALLSKVQDDITIKSQNIDFATMPGYNYSTDEQVVGVWIDGKLIYRKTVSTTTGNNVLSWNTIPGISNVDNMVDAYGYMNHSATDQYRIPYADHNNDISLKVNKTTHVIQEAHSAAIFNSKPIVVTLEYTKITG